MCESSEEREEALRSRRAMVNALFDAVAHEKGLREAAIFTACYGADEARADLMLHKFLKEVATCPLEVIEFCQHMLAPRRE